MLEAKALYNVILQGCAFQNDNAILFSRVRVMFLPL